MPIGPDTVSFSLEDLQEVLPRDQHGELPSKRAVSRWLQREGIPVAKVGNRCVVWLTDLAAKMPALQRAVELRLAGRAA